VQILNAAEEREKQVVGLEEELARRRRDLEHEHSTRLTEAEATVRRLQVPLPLLPSHTFYCTLHSAEKARCQVFKYKASPNHIQCKYKSNTMQVQSKNQADTEQIPSKSKVSNVHDQGMGNMRCDVLVFNMPSTVGVRVFLDSVLNQTLSMIRAQA